jgi:N6-adenosine-specific RNA methylase IME4
MTALQRPIREVIEIKPYTAEEFASRIAQCWKKSVEAIIEAGRLLIQAKKLLPHGEFGAMIEARLPFGACTARRLIAIAADRRISNRAHAHVLPPHWGTLYELTKLDDVAFEARIADGSIRPDMERRDIASAVKLERRETRERELGKKIAAGNLALPAEQFGVIVADPAWGRTVYGEETGMDRHASNHFPVAKGDEGNQDDAIRALPVASIAADDCVLGLWCTDPHRGVDVMRAWGFEPKSYFVWIKDIVGVEISVERRVSLGLGPGRIFQIVGAPGTGFWNRDRDELMLIGVRGQPVCPAPGVQGESVWFARRGEHASARETIHSDKPNCSFEWFERHWPNTPRIELNARRARPGWEVWGFEAPLIVTADCHERADHTLGNSDSDARCVELGGEIGDGARMP